MAVVVVGGVNGGGIRGGIAVFGNIPCGGGLINIGFMSGGTPGGGIKPGGGIIIRGGIPTFIN